MAAAHVPVQMRSAQWTTVPIESSLRVNQTTPLPKDSALVIISYASINPVDYKVPEFGLARFTAMGNGPWIPACDYAGTVISTNLPHVKPGDKVAGCTALPEYGALAGYAVVEGAENVSKLPENVDLEDAATLSSCSDSHAMHRAIREGRLQGCHQQRKW